MLYGYMLLNVFAIEQNATKIIYIVWGGGGLYYYQYFVLYLFWNCLGAVRVTAKKVIAYSKGFDSREFNERTMYQCVGRIKGTNKKSEAHRNQQQ